MPCGIETIPVHRSFAVFRSAARGVDDAHSGQPARHAVALVLLVCALGHLERPVSGQEFEWLEKTIRLRGLPDNEIPVVTSVAIHPTEDLLATAGDDHLVRLWDLKTGQIQRTLQAHGDWVTCVAFSNDGQRLITGGRDRRLLLWDLRTTVSPVAMGKHRQPISGITVHPTTNMVAVAGFRAPLKVYDAATGELLGEFRCPCSDTRALSFSPNGISLAAGGRNGKIRLWNLRSGEQFDLQAHRRRITSVVFASDDRLLSSGEDQRIHVWDIHRRVRQNTLSNESGKVLAMTMLDANRFAIGTAKNTIVLCDLREALPFGVLRGHTGSVAAIVARGNRLISGSFDTTARIWKITNSERENQAALTRRSTALE